MQQQYPEVAERRAGYSGQNTPDKPDDDAKGTQYGKNIIQNI
jgi:hypothetical protein